MKKLFTLLFVILAANLSLAGEFESDLDDFNTVIASGNFKIFLTQGDKNHILVKNNEPELQDDEITFEVKAGELKVDIKGNTFKKLELEIYVTYKKVIHLQTKGGAWIKCETPLKGDEIELKCTQDGIISAELDCETVRASIITDGDIKLRGKVNVADFKVNAGGFISAVNCKAGSVTAKVATGGEISCWADKMDLKVNTGGTIKYKYEGENESKDVKQKTVIAGDIKKIKT